MYAVDWALTLFTRSLPLNLAFRLWDCFVLVGTPFFFQASMGTVYLHLPLLVNACDD
jgi:TBC1 domain family member 14